MQVEKVTAAGTPLGWLQLHGVSRSPSAPCRAGLCIAADGLIAVPELWCAKKSFSMLAVILGWNWTSQCGSHEPQIYSAPISPELQHILSLTSLHLNPCTLYIFPSLSESTMHCSTLPTCTQPALGLPHPSAALPNSLPWSSSSSHLTTQTSGVTMDFWDCHC